MKRHYREFRSYPDRSARRTMRFLLGVALAGLVIWIAYCLG